jgi:exopolysaccharide production protein ExoQ
MPSQLILLCTYGFAVWLFRKDLKWRHTDSAALLIPGLWIAILGSRPVSEWIGGGGGGGDVEGSPINTLTFGLLIVLAIRVLNRRGVDWGAVVGRNKALFLIFFFLAVSAFWSQIPFVSLKRLFKIFGCVPVAMVILTEADPAAALRAVFVRVSYFLFPLSVVLIKYFPQIGRQVSHSGENMFTGVTTQKNSLGLLIFVFFPIILWDLLELIKDKNDPQRKKQMAIRIGILFLGAWLLQICDSQTSFLCLVVGLIIFWGSGRLIRMKHGKPVLISGLTLVFGLMALDKTFGLSDTVVAALGRNPTLTGRTDIWRVVMEQKTDPIIGEGFYTFWDTKGANVTDQLMKINSTHNGYLEMYVDGGLVGDCLLALLLLSAGGRVIQRLFAGGALARLGLTYWFTTLIYNLSESSFFRLEVLWFTFLLMIIECRQRSPQFSFGEHLEQIYEPRKVAAGV